MPTGPFLLRVSVTNLEAFFDDSRTAVPPHTGRMLDEGFADFLETAVREHQKAPAVELEVAVQSPPASADLEERVRSQFHHYFADEADRAQLDERVNRVEGRGSFRYALPIILAAGVVALLVYVVVGLMPPESLLVAFLVGMIYLVFITFVWVLLWDPIEQIYFEGYMLHVRTSAVEKLSKSTIRFTYSAAGA